MHLDNLFNHPSAADSGNLGFIAYTFDDDGNHKFHYFEYNDENSTSPPILRIRRMNLTSPIRDYFRFVGSCNGLICLARGQSVCISNPITKEVVMLPEIVVMSKCDCCILYCRCWKTGFGYVSSTNEYKIVVICTRETEFVEVYMYTLGSGNGWRKLGKFDFESSKNGCKVSLLMGFFIGWTEN
ncbi:uncharacterized protein LOC113325305 [Papaver somniferum]|uniref:uncharacterized protein LOC113325305 n=1 Tax=Papaver somniferum TaxID=3469 RepID=UPI000E704E13|nr:uncharacterized protein LOC113325305 [Papaver somniferum]